MSNKWNSEMVIRMFDIYNKYLELWYSRFKEYGNRFLLEQEFRKLLGDLLMLLPGITIEMLRAKIKISKMSSAMSVSKYSNPENQILASVRQWSC